jgi:uncharacterized repeat protein (TIGR01451 family)
MKTILHILFIFTFLYILFTFPVNAQTPCQPIYGGGQTCVPTGNILVDKKVLDPKTKKMTDNLTINDSKFQPGSIINFQIALTNTGKAEIKQIKVKDIFPQYIGFTNGPGNFDANTQTLAFEVANLKPKETRNFTVTGTVVDESRLPISLGIICAVVQTIATTTDAGTSQDNTQFCIQKTSLSSSAGQKQVLAAQIPNDKFTVLPAPVITTTPATGSQLFPLLALIPAGIAGLFLKKKGNSK